MKKIAGFLCTLLVITSVLHANSIPKNPASEDVPQDITAPAGDDFSGARDVPKKLFCRVGYAFRGEGLSVEPHPTVAVNTDLTIPDTKEAENFLIDLSDAPVYQPGAEDRLYYVLLVGRDEQKKAPIFVLQFNYNYDMERGILDDVSILIGLLEEKKKTGTLRERVTAVAKTFETGEGRTYVFMHNSILEARRGYSFAWTFWYPAREGEPAFVASACEFR